MTQTPDEPRDDPSGEARARAFAMAPRLLVALAGACTLSGVVGFAVLLSGAGALPVPLLLAPPVLVLAAAPLWFARSRAEGVR